MKRIFLAAAIAAAAISTTIAQDVPVAAQEKPAPAPTTSKQLTPLRVHFVLSRLQGEKKISSLPYTLGVLANGRQTNMRMGITVPVTQTVFGAGKEGGPAMIPQASYTYRDVGTNIDCAATDVGGGNYSLGITVEDSSIQSETGDKAAKIVRDVPIFRRFNASFSMLLRDGQTMQYVSVTDPLNGEVMRIEVTLNLAK
jgi:opacity protein-like surface antigen